jgi:hypothetical protein
MSNSLATYLQPLEAEGIPASGEQRLLLGTREDMDDIATAFEKGYEHRSRLASAKTTPSV